MSITIECGDCGKTYKVRDELAGTRRRCLECGGTIVVPGGEEPPIAAVPLDATPAAPIPAAPIPAAPSPNLPVKDTMPTDLASTADLASAQQMIAQGMYLEATQSLKAVEQEAGEHPGYYYLNGLAYAGLGNYPHALDNFTRAVNAGVRTAPAFAAKGHAELQLQQFPAAIESLDNALSLAGTDVPDYMADLALAYEGASMRQDAFATWNALKQINPNHPAIIERRRLREERRERKHARDSRGAMVQMQKEQRASDTACWICILLRCLCECM